jgi:enoyl-CoA hydratase
VDTVTLTEPIPGVGVLTLNRPDRLNALSFELVAALHDTLDVLDRRNDIRVVVLTGAGRGFCSGLDLRELGPSRDASGLDGPAAGMRGQGEIARLIPRIRSIPQPVIAAVNGPAVGGGFALALAADIRIAATSARFGVQFVKVGLSGCDIGVSWLLPRLVGASRAFELILTGRQFDAEEADGIGLVSRVVPDGTALDSALETASVLLEHGAFGLVMTKEVMWANLSVPNIEAGIALENRTQILSSYAGDFVAAQQRFRDGVR